MKVVFANEFDGIIESGTPLVGVAYCGGKGLLSLLAIKLGLTRPDSSSVNRIQQFQSKLEHSNSENMFYSASFFVDPLTTAKTLLDWRDSWIEANWDPEISVTSKRVSDLAIVEKNDLPLSPGWADLVSSVRRDLKKRSSSPLFDEVNTLVPREQLPPWIVEILDLLGARYSDQNPEPTAKEDTDLSRLQKALIDGEHTQFRNDGSVVLVESTIPRIAAQMVASELTISENTRIIATTESSILGRAIESRGKPRISTDNRSACRPISQLLKLVANLLWEPRDPHNILQFLQHPWCPLNRKVSYRLARTFVRSPGVGGGGWKSSIDRIVEGFEAKEAKATRKEISFWLENSTFVPKNGADSETVVQRFEKLAASLKIKLQKGVVKSQAASLRAGISSCESLCEVVSASGKELISYEEIDYWVRSLTGLGINESITDAEIGSMEVVDHEISRTKIDNLFWWGFQNAKLPSRLPWGKTELKDLESAGCLLEMPEHQMSALTYNWIQAVCSAKEKLCLIRMNSLDGKTVSHPLIDEIASISPELGEPGALKIVRPESIFFSDESKDQFIDDTIKLSARSLPAPRRWWRLPENTEIPRRETESFSSIEKLIYSPYQWVLERVARIESGSLLVGSNENILRGNVAHGVIEAFFNECDWKNTSEDSIAGWADLKIAQIFAQEASVFNVPGNQRAREEIFDHVKATLMGMTSQFLAMGVNEVICEQEQTGKFEGGNLTGFIDILLKLEDDSEAVVDVKYGWRSKRIDELRSNGHLQLAVYAALRYQMTGKWPKDVAYFLVRNAELLAQSSAVFTSAKVQQPRENLSSEDLWQRLCSVWQWRREQLDQGLIELTTSNTSPDEMSVPPEDTIKLDPSYDEYSNYKILAGRGDRI